MIIIAPNTMPKANHPTASDCSKLIGYANGVIDELKNVSAILAEVSADADEGLVAMQEWVADMISTAKKMKTNLQTIRDNSEVTYF